jgi:predicted DNA-binding WGR domain protein
MFWQRRTGRDLFEPHELAVIDAVAARLFDEGRSRFEAQIASIGRVQRLFDGEDVECYPPRGASQRDPAIAFENKNLDLKLATVAVRGPAAMGKAVVTAVGGHLFEIRFRPRPKALGDKRSIIAGAVTLHVDPMQPDTSEPGAARLAELQPAIRVELERIWASSAGTPLLRPEELYSIGLSDGDYVVLGQLPDTTFLVAPTEPGQPRVYRYDPGGDRTGSYGSIAAALESVEPDEPVGGYAEAKRPADDDGQGGIGPGRLLPAGVAPAGGRVYLEYVGGGSSKFYAVVLDEDAEAAWSVSFNFGRIGAPRAWQKRIDRATFEEAKHAFDALVEEKLGKGYERRPWPPTLLAPGGAETELGSTGGTGDPVTEVLFRAERRGTLPAAHGAVAAGIPLPEGRVFSAEQLGGSRGPDPLLWVSSDPVKDVGAVWARLAAAFGDTGLWPLVVDAGQGLDAFPEILMDIPRGRHAEALAILRRSWNENVGEYEEDETGFLKPLTSAFPGLATRTPGDRPSSIDALVRDLTGHLGIVALNRPADTLDALGWGGAVNFDHNPFDQSVVLRSWEDRFDAYVVGIGFDALVLAVGRPPRDITAATAIAAEHLAFCPDNIFQGVGTIRDYSRLLLNASRWEFWWD